MSVEDEYDRFATFVADQPFSRDVNYIETLVNLGMVKSRKEHRTLVEIVREIGRGIPVREWKKKLVPNGLCYELVTLRDGKRASVSYDLLEINYIFLGMFLPNFDDRVHVGSWRDAKSNNCLKSYFGVHDIFDVAEGEGDNFVYEYSGDYFEYMRSLPIGRRVIVYRNYLLRNSVSVPVRKNDFCDPRYFVSVSERQMGEYENILSQIVRDERNRFVFVGDGLGAGSILSIKNNYNYISSESAGVGNLAIRLGIISCTQIRSTDVYDTDILVLFNVEEYLSADERKYYMSMYSKIVVFNERGFSEMCEVKDGTGKLASRGVLYKELPKIKEVAKVKDYLDVRSPVAPQDVKSLNYVLSNKIVTSSVGFKVSYDNIDGAFNIRTRAYPSNLKMARRGDVKIVDGIKFEYEREGQVVVTPSQAFKYYPYDPGSSNILPQGKYRMEKDCVVAILRRPRQIRMFENEEGIIVPIYYLYSRKNGEIYEAVYSLINVGVINDVKNVNYQVGD